MWEVKNYSQEYLVDMLEMTREYYGDIEISNIEFIKHQYFNNPAGEALIKLAYDIENNVLAGQYITIPMNVRAYGSDFRVILSLNTLTRETYRGQNIFTTLANSMFNECKTSEIQFCYGAPNQNSYHGFVTKLKFNEIGTIPLFVKILKPSQLIKNKLRITMLSKICHPLDYFFKKSRMISTDYTIKELSEKDIHLFDKLWATINNKYPIMFVRNSQYMLWRYFQIPLKKYKVYMAFENNIPIGYIIGRITNIANMKCGMITDFIFKSEHEIAGNLLVNNMTVDFLQQDVELAGCLMQSHFQEATLLRKQGYFICPKFMQPQPFPIILRNFNSTTCNKNLYNFQNWFFTMGDYDAI